MKRVILLAIVTGSLSACASQEEKLCRTSVKATLLNPETAEFSDFRKYSNKEIEADEFLSHMPEIMEGTVPTKGASYYRMRVRADGEIGNKITKLNFCAIDAKRTSCSCVASN